jgi:hypothetical protein
MLSRMGACTRLSSVALVMFSSIYSTALAFEDAVVLPKGVRRAMINTFHTEFSKETGPQGQSQPMSDRIARNVTFQDFIKVRQGLERTQLQAILKVYGLAEDEVVGDIKADMQGRIDVFAPSFSYGITDKLSLGFVVPFYYAQTDVAVGFTPHSSAENFVGLLASPELGQTAKAHEAVDAINNVTETLNQKLTNNGYSKLGYWSGKGLGDIMVKAKYQAYRGNKLRAATTFGFVAPTGRTDDPDILTDVGFGDGTWDIITGVGFDQIIGGPFFLNQYVMYTAQLPASREVRMKTREEAIEVEKKTVSYDLGDKIDSGLSLQFDTQLGLQGGLGYIYQHKFKDKYNAGESSAVYEENTTQSAHLLESSLGYSSVNSYFRKETAVPYAGSVGYLRQLKSKNMPVAHRYQFEMKVFF